MNWVKLVLYMVVVLWSLMFIDTRFGTDLYHWVYLSGVHNALMLFSLVMALIVPILFIVRLRERNLRLHHWLSGIAWLLYLYCIYDEVVVHQAY